MRLLRTFVAFLSVIPLLLMLAACTNPADVTATATPDMSTSGPNETTSTAIVGEWIVISLNDTQVAGSVVPTVVFTEEGVVSGQAGCNTFGGTYTTDENNGIVLTDVTTTLMACEDEAIMSQETALLEALQQTTLYLIEGNTLTLTDDGGTALAVLNRDA